MNDASLIMTSKPVVGSLTVCSPLRFLTLSVGFPFGPDILFIISAFSFMGAWVEVDE